VYEDYGPIYRPRNMISSTWFNRPYCDLCGPFRGRYLRQIGVDEFGSIWRCRDCDEEFD
jgi:ribosomal protein L37AE/L43A